MHLLEEQAKQTGLLAGVPYTHTHNLTAAFTFCPSPYESYLNPLVKDEGS